MNAIGDVIGAIVRICRDLEALGLVLDANRNAATIGTEGEITVPGSRVRAYVIPTNEELLIARDTVQVVSRAIGRESAAT